MHEYLSKEDMICSDKRGAVKFPQDNRLSWNRKNSNCSAQHSALKREILKVMLLILHYQKNNKKINSNSNKLLLIYVWVTSLSSSELAKLFWVSSVLIIKVIAIMWMMRFLWKLSARRKAVRYLTDLKFLWVVPILFFLKLTEIVTEFFS